jgi:hypothetical protein
MSLASRVTAELRTRYARAVALQTPDADLWGSLVELTALHRPALDAHAGQSRCLECTRGDYGRVWPCQTLRLLAAAVGAVGVAPQARRNHRQTPAPVPVQRDGGPGRRGSGSFPN